MLYESTRGGERGISSESAIVKGIASDGGLFVPDGLFELSEREFDELAECTYRDAAKRILGRFFTGFSEAELSSAVNAAYGDNFDCPETAPLRRLPDGVFSLELWHGPTCAFKDMALQLMPKLLSHGIAKLGLENDVAILTATSGDTGKAALEGFRDVPRTKIVVFYPEDGVSAIQKLQMTTQEGDNVCVFAAKGNFDDAQRGVKAMFSDEDFNRRCNEAGYSLSSANSINWGRLAPQIVYYLYACSKLRACGALKNGKQAAFCVPTGNFGNILACWYAKRLGAPIGRIICASNSNNVLTDFINVGVYDTGRPFRKTLSPSMDILVSSNLERLLYELSGRDGGVVCKYMLELAEKGRYTVSDDLSGKIKDVFSAASASDVETLGNIALEWSSNGYLCDPHTAVAFGALSKLTLPDELVPVVVSTASPFKFPCAVLGAIAPNGGRALDGFAAMDELERVSGIKAPAALRSLQDKREIFTRTLNESEREDAVLEFLKKGKSQA